VDTSVVIKTVAGNGAGGQGGARAATKVKLSGPEALVIDAHGNLYVSEVLDPHGIIRTSAGGAG